jgi:hypothetical protein
MAIGHRRLFFFRAKEAQKGRCQEKAATVPCDIWVCGGVWFARRQSGDWRSREKLSSGSTHRLSDRYSSLVPAAFDLLGRLLADLYTARRPAGLPACFLGRLLSFCVCGRVDRPLSFAEPA